MTREEAAVYVWETYEMCMRLYENARADKGMMSKTKEAFDVAIVALRGPQPDPATGLVPCGCGGMVFVYCPVDMTDVFVIRCEKCRVGITFAMDLLRAKKEWNTAMGWKGECGKMLSGNTEQVEINP